MTPFHAKRGRHSFLPCSPKRTRNTRKPTSTSGRLFPLQEATLSSLFGCEASLLTAHFRGLKGVAKAGARINTAHSGNESRKPALCTLSRAQPRLGRQELLNSNPNLFQAGLIGGFVFRGLSGILGGELMTFARLAEEARSRRIASWSNFNEPKLIATLNKLKGDSRKC